MVLHHFLEDRVMLWLDVNTGYNLYNKRGDSDSRYRIPYNALLNVAWTVVNVFKVMPPFLLIAELALAINLRQNVHEWHLKNRYERWQDHMSHLDHAEYIKRLKEVLVILKTNFPPITPYLRAVLPARNLSS